MAEIIVIVIVIVTIIDIVIAIVIVIVIIIKLLLQSSGLKLEENTIELSPKLDRESQGPIVFWTNTEKTEDEISDRETKFIQFSFEYSPLYHFGCLSREKI